MRYESNEHFYHQVPSTKSTYGFYRLWVMHLQTIDEWTNDRTKKGNDTFDISTSFFFLSFGRNQFTICIHEGMVGWQKFTIPSIKHYYWMKYYLCVFSSTNNISCCFLFNFPSSFCTFCLAAPSRRFVTISCVDCIPKWNCKRCPIFKCLYVHCGTWDGILSLRSCYESPTP